MQDLSFQKEKSVSSKETVLIRQLPLAKCRRLSLGQREDGVLVMTGKVGMMEGVQAHRCSL